MYLRLPGSVRSTNKCFHKNMDWVRSSPIPTKKLIWSRETLISMYMSGKLCKYGNSDIYVFSHASKI